LGHGLVSHPAIERRLIALRRGAVHLAVYNPAALGRYHRLLVLMAIRAFQAEYIDQVGAAERSLLDRLDLELAKTDSAEQDSVESAARFAVYAAYRPLHR